MQACCCRLRHMSLLRITFQPISTSSRHQMPSCDAKTDISHIRDLKMPEEPTTCCMSGCANCVWIQYAEELSKLLGAAGPSKAKQIIMERVSDPNVRAYLLTELSMIQNKTS